MKPLNLKTRKNILPKMPVVLIMMALVLTGCSTDTQPSRKVILLSAGGEASGSGATSQNIAGEQMNGYQRFINENDSFTILYKDESMADKDLQRSIRDEVQNSEQPLMALVGGTSNAASGQGAALVNFFNVPLIIPSAYGDNLFPVGNLWAFRLSPPSSVYANTLFGSYVTKSEIETLREKLTDPLNPAPVFNIAIIYEQNTFGEAAAVATAQAANAQEIRIGSYQHFSANSTDVSSLRKIVDGALLAQPQLVYLIASDPSVATVLVKTFATAVEEGTMPALIGQGGAFSSSAFTSSDVAEDVYILRQVIDRASCPNDVNSEFEAQSYAAMSLLSYAFQVAEESHVTRSGVLAFLDRDTRTIGEKRETLRDAIKTTDIALPCMGKIGFDNNGQNTLVKIELVKKVNGQWQNIDQQSLIEDLHNIMFEGMFQ